MSAVLIGLQGTRPGYRCSRDYRRPVERYREGITEYGPEQAADTDFVAVIDVREPVERLEGSIPDSAVLPRALLEREIAGVVVDRDAPILLYCVIGESSILAAHTLQTLGYTNVVSLAGGFRRWRDEGYPYVLDDALAADERIRYDRQLRLDGVGSAGQHRLLSSAVVVVGAGGLGSPAALYLAAAGVEAHPCSRSLRRVSGTPEFESP